jgi:hypothetical protein
MLLFPAPMSNTERQRRFRERNPGYYGRLHARKRARSKADVLEMQRVAAAEAMIARRQPLALPAPAERIEIPGMTTIPATHAIPALAPLTRPAEPSLFE